MRIKNVTKDSGWFGEPPVNKEVHPPLPDELVLRLSKSQEKYPVKEQKVKSVKKDQVGKYLVPFPQKQQQQQQKPRHQQKGSSQQDIGSRSEKNICTYIERAIINALLSQQYKHIVQRMCLKYKCQYNLAIGYFEENSKSFGISHLIKMMTPKKQKDISINKLFNAFLKYFLRNQYLIKMLKSGKMYNKNLYLKVKNRLLYLSETIPEQQITSSNQDIQADVYQPQFHQFQYVQTMYYQQQQITSSNQDIQADVYQPQFKNAQITYYSLYCFMSGDKWRSVFE